MKHPFTAPLLWCETVCKIMFPHWGRCYILYFVPSTISRLFFFFLGTYFNCFIYPRSLFMHLVFTLFSGFINTLSIFHRWIFTPLCVSLIHFSNFRTMYPHMFVLYYLLVILSKIYFLLPSCFILSFKTLASFYAYVSICHLQFFSILVLKGPVFFPPDIRGGMHSSNICY